MYGLTQHHLRQNPEKLERFDKVRIWSRQWILWWLPNAQGYTANINEAGIYDIDDAWKLVKDLGKEKGIMIYQVKKAEIDFLEKLEV